MNRRWKLPLYQKRRIGFKKYAKCFFMTLENIKFIALFPGHLKDILTRAVTGNEAIYLLALVVSSSKQKRGESKCSRYPGAREYGEHTRFFYKKVRIRLIIKTFLRNQRFINKIFLTTFLILVVFGNYRAINSKKIC